MRTQWLTMGMSLLAVLSTGLQTSTAATEYQTPSKQIPATGRCQTGSICHNQARNNALMLYRIIIKPLPSCQSKSCD